MENHICWVRLWRPFHEWKARSSIIERPLQFVSKVWCCNCTQRKKKRNDTKRSYDIWYLNSKMIIMKGGQFGSPNVWHHSILFTQVHLHFWYNTTPKQGAPRQIIALNWLSFCADKSQQRSTRVTFSNSRREWKLLLFNLPHRDKTRIFEP